MGGWVEGGGVGGGQGGCERRIEVFVKILKKKNSGGGGRVGGQGECERRIEVFRGEGEGGVGGVEGSGWMSG